MIAKLSNLVFLGKKHLLFRTEYVQVQIKVNKILPLLAFAVLALGSCRSYKTTVQIDTSAPNVDSALATRLTPKFSPEYYIDQGVKYFLTMGSSVSNNVQPYYSDLVIRWEWPPWLKLTGYKRRNLVNTDIHLKLYPTKYDTIDCQYFEVQPFAVAT